MEEINNKLDEGINIQEVSNNLGLSKSSVLLMLRMQSVFFEHYKNTIESLQDENNNLNECILSLNSDKLDLIDEIEELSMQVAPLEKNDDISLKSYQSLKSDYDYLKMDYDNLKYNFQITRNNLAKIPIWLRQFYKANEVG